MVPVREIVPSTGSLSAPQSTAGDWEDGGVKEDTQSIVGGRSKCGWVGQLRLCTQRCEETHNTLVLMDRDVNTCICMLEICLLVLKTLI